MDKLDLRSMEYDEIINFFLENNHPKFRGEQIFNWINQKKITEIDEMTNLSKDLRIWLKEKAYLSEMKVKNKQVSDLDGTVKYLFELDDKNCIETVQMEYNHGSSLCVSTQVGCKMGCKFCASTINGLVRNLTAGEILNQIYMAEKISGKRISHVVLMGIGEPLDNLYQVSKFLRIVSSDKGINISLRNISLSTCGIVPKIKELADLSFPITLSVSLHASNDKARDQIMPVNKKWNIKEVLSACKYYYDKTNRRITFEYALINGVNDSKKEAQELANILRGINCHINLIPVNPIEGTPYKKSDRKAVKDFADALESKGFSTTIRRELGSDISAACGQLRHEDKAV